MGFKSKGYHYPPANSNAIRYILGSCNTTGNYVCTTSVLVGATTTTDNVNITVKIKSTDNIVYNPSSDSSTYPYITGNLTIEIESISVNKETETSYTFPSGCPASIGITITKTNNTDGSNKPEGGSFVTIPNTTTTTTTTIETNAEYNINNVSITFNTLNPQSRTYYLSVDSNSHCNITSETINYSFSPSNYYPIKVTVN
jgi:hypothetical protein